jgi:peptide/nickel transport system permease protein
MQLLRWYGRLVQGRPRSIDLSPQTRRGRHSRPRGADASAHALRDFIAVLIGVPVGVLSARHHNTATDQTFMVFALLGISVPNFLLGLIFVLVLRRLARVVSRGRVLAARGWLALTARSLVLPAFSLGLVQSALIARIARSSMLDVLREQFITTGRAKGLGERIVVYKHALRNALVPTVTVIGISFAVLISGAVVVETVFNIPGLGRLVVSAVSRRDYPVVQGVVLVIAGVYMLVNLLVDLSYLVIDPRVKYQ